MNLIKPLTLSLALATPLHAEIDIQPVISPQGITGWLVEERSIPFVAIEVIFPGGANLDPDSAEGAVSLMSALLSEGAGDLDAQGYAAALESLAGSVSFSAGRDSVSLSIHALSENRDQVIDLARLARVLGLRAARSSEAICWAWVRASEAASKRGSISASRARSIT